MFTAPVNSLRRRRRANGTPKRWRTVCPSAGLGRLDRGLGYRLPSMLGLYRLLCMRDAVLYTRVSTREQEDEGFSLQAQRQLLET